MDRRHFTQSLVAMTGSLVVGACRSPRQPDRTAMFMNFVKYRDLDRIADARQAHFAYADRLRARGELVIGGPLLDEQARRIGLLFIYKAGSRDAALAFAREDPFTRANALRSSEITDWRVQGANLDLLAAANRSADQGGGDQTKPRLFVNYAKYTADKTKVATVRPAHREYDRTLKGAGKLALAGPFANDEGGLFVYRAASRDEAVSYRDQDPFAVQGVVATSELLEWLVEGVNPDLLGSVGE